GRDDALKLHARYLTAKLIPLGFRRSQQVLILFNDITRQKQARDELDEHMLRLEEKVSHKTARYKEIHLEFQKELAYRKKIQRDLESALEQVKQLRGLLPICASCKNIRDDNGYWSQIEGYIEKHSDVTFTHGLCPDCGKKLYPELFDTDIEEP
ncbi:MAG: sensor with HAMP domain protein, partial [Thermodesulfobacteriota bacterium]